MNPAALIADLAGQLRAHRERRWAAEQVARAAARTVAVGTGVDVNRYAANGSPNPARRLTGVLVERRLFDELEGAVAEWQAARGRTGAVTVDLGAVVLSTCWQPHAAPIVDQAAVTVAKVDTDVTPPAQTFEQLRGRAIRSPWRRAGRAEHRALVIARRRRPDPWAGPLTTGPRSLPQ